MNIPEPRAFCDAAIELVNLEVKLLASCFPRMVDASAAHYVRERDLPYVRIGLYPEDYADYSIHGTRYIITKLMVAANTARNLGMAQHWSYQLNEHVAILACLTGEKARLAELEAQ